MLYTNTRGHGLSKTLLLTFLIFLFSFPSSASASFTDVSSIHRNFPAISYLEEQGLIKGYDDGTFKPDLEITRAELVKLTLAHVGYKPSEQLYETRFSDVPAGSWFAPYVKKALDLQAIQINPSLPLFYPASPISRIEALKIIMPLEGIPAPYIKDDTPVIFSDVNENAEFTYLVIAAQKSGLYTKSDGTLFKPFQNLTRGEAAELLYRSAIYRNAAGEYDMDFSYESDEDDFYSSTDYDLINNPKFPIFLDVWEKINSDYIDSDSVDQDDLVYGAIQGMVFSLDDPYSVFEKPEDAKEIEDSLEGNFEGIGVVLDIFEGNIMITAVLKDSPADKAGLKPGDIIKKVDGIIITGKEIEEVVPMIKGPAGSEVSLAILRDGRNLNFVIKREQLKLDSVLIENTSESVIPADIGYISIYQFTSDTASEFIPVLENTIAKKPKGIILDLRDNPGGYLDEAYEILNYFVEEGKPIANIRIGTRILPELSEGPGKFTEANIPLIILVNEGSASAAEVVAGTLQDYKIGKLLGTTTYGKGTVQEVSTYSDDSFFKLSVAHWLTAKENDIDKVGLTPDIVFEMSVEDISNGKDSQLEKAISEIRGS